MSSTEVVHCRKDPYTVYIGRPGPWGNPFRVGSEGKRGECIEMFREWVTTSDEAGARWMRDHVHELAGEVLGCWCRPRACHGDVLVALADGQDLLPKTP